MPTQKELKRLFHYDPETGLFTRLVFASSNAPAGVIAGTTEIQGYISIRIDKKSYKAHRLAWVIMTGEWPENQVDHINHIRDDNRWVNLREATNQENQQNASVRSDNVSGVPGVFWENSHGKWVAQIKANKKRRHLGYFDDKFEAICARLSANNKYGFHTNHGK